MRCLLLWFGDPERRDKLQALTGDTPALIATANVGCQLHLGEAAGTPIVHWIELLEDC